MKHTALLFLYMCAIFLCQAEMAKSEEEVIDGLVAVVGDEIILLSDMQKQLSGEMMRRKLDYNETPRTVLLGLRDEIVTGMVDDLLIIEKAKQDTTIVLDPKDIDLEVNSRMSDLRRQMGSEEAYKGEFENYGLTELQFRNMVRVWVTKEFLKYRFMSDLERHISVTPQEIESWITAHKDSLPAVPEQFKVSHILLYPRVSEEKKQAAVKKIKGILERVRAGEDFAELAKQYSEDPGNSESGGDLGYFKRDEFDKDFTVAAFALQKGEISDPIETVFGYHIIKVEDIRGDEIWARHILVRVTIDEDDEKKVVERLNQFRDDMLSEKATFEDIANQYSEDENSNKLGGKLDWFARDVMIPSFPDQAEKLKIGEISEPFKSQYGLHILKLDNHKEAHMVNIKDDRTLLESEIHMKKKIEEYNRIIQKLRQETYIDVRLD